MPDSSSSPAPELSRLRRPAPRLQGAQVSPIALGWIRVLVFLLSLGPLVRLIVFGLTDQLGANPIEFITRSTGTWTLVFLCLTLTITPLRRLTKLNSLIRLRRMLGLFAFFYAVLHFTAYIWFDQWFDLTSIAKDIYKRPFITVGFAAFVLLIPLAVTSTKAMVRRLGSKRWLALHRLVYLIAALAILHFWWGKAGKHDFEQPLLYGMAVAALLGARVWWWLRRKREQPVRG